MMLAEVWPGRTIVVVGTDTEVGKTFVGASLAIALRRVGHRVVAVKPIESGCAEVSPPQRDGQTLAAATEQAWPTSALLQLPQPITPALAADREGVEIAFDTLLAGCRRAATEAQADVLLVEGAGGLRSPLTWSHDSVDLIHGLQARVLLVASDELGTLNHTLLTLEALGREIPLADRLLGVVLSAPATPDASTGGNRDVLQRIAGAVSVCCVPRLESPCQGADWMGPVLEWAIGD